ncbi:protein matrimony [Drosophila eugracilis]|uniref:protein matrimony n=1 Tax=Drosophila eugracilis TaxID=29029 RepID=UPI0007E67B54|nr:protein matrimony [Drosophila eugracilis]
MENYRTPINETKIAFNRTPTLKERKWNTLKVNTSNVRCSTPIFGNFRSPNLSPIESMCMKKSPVSPMRFETLMKPPMKVHHHRHQRQHHQHIHRTQLKPPVFNLPKPQEEVIEPEREFKSCSSPDTCSDDSNMETSLTLETRRRSIKASNHSYVVNHAANVEQVLMHMGLENYVTNFEEAHIDLVELASMERADLMKIGLKAEEDCNRIMDALQTL